jgi:DNA-directed RNA polymerase subunit M/transcription elongation factor TFIIS
MLPSHKRAIDDIVNCRTEALGGHAYFCDDCHDYRYSFHSCKNRNCNKCGHGQAQHWLDKQRSRLLPVTYFMATFTLHDNLRKVAASNQKIIYDLLFQTSAAALQKLADDPEYVGGRIAMAGVLQTWTRNLSVLHPHVHYIIPGGGLAENGSSWLPARHHDFLMPKRALSKIFRAKFRDQLKKTHLFNSVPPQTWKQKWVVHLKPIGSGERALKYLAPYIFQVAISNKRLVKLEDGMVTFLYKPSKTTRWKRKSIPVEKFLHNFLQHVLPPRFVKVRYYGLFSSQKRQQLDKVKKLLDVQNSKPEDDTTNTKQSESSDESKDKKPKTLRCPKCGNLMRWVKEMPPMRMKMPFQTRAP